MTALPQPDPRPEPTPEQWEAFYGHLAAVLASAWRNLAPAARAALGRSVGEG